MDPDGALEQLLAQARALQKAHDAGDAPDPIDVDDLTTHILDLHQWLSRGGFLPKAWGGAPEPREFTVPVMIDIIADNRELAGEAVAQILADAALVEQSAGSARIVSWWMLEQQDKHWDGNDQPSGCVAFD